MSRATASWPCSPNQPRNLLGFSLSLVRWGNSPGHITSVITEDLPCASTQLRMVQKRDTGGVPDHSATPAAHTQRTPWSAESKPSEKAIS